MCGTDCKYGVLGKVHPMGKCNRAMSALLKKHRSGAGDEDTSLEDQLIDEMDSMDSVSGDTATDPRWDELKKLSDNN